MASSKEYVVHGACLKCTMGSKDATLKVSNNRKYTMNGKKVATIMDFAPGINIFPPVGAFGVCKPYSAVPPPGNMCTPILVGPWKMPYMPESIGMLRPLLGNSIIMCGRGGGVVSISKTGQNTQAPVIVKDNKEKCPLCGKDHPVRKIKEQGDPVGSGSTLGRRLKRTRNPFHYAIELTSKLGKKYRAGSLQAHHLVLASTCNNDEDVAETIRKYGYDINYKKNGELLPGFMDLACWLQKPVHNTNHDGGEAVSESTNEYSSYSIVVKQRAIKIIQRYINSNVCEYDDSLINKLNALSNEIRDNILNFVWTISEDGWDYAPGNPIGCGNADSLEGKKGKQNSEPNCKCERNHIIKKIKEIQNKIEQIKI